MDEQTFAHLAKWIDERVPADEIDTVLGRIMAFVRDYPDMIGTRSWSDIRALADRYAQAAA